MTSEQVRFTADTTVAFTDRSGDDEPVIDSLHLEDLAPILEIDDDKGTVAHCELDIERLVDVMSLYASMEELQYDWRQPGV